MAYESLKASLDAKIYTNGNEEVTASMVNSVISDCISQLGNFECGGEITPTTLFDFNTELKWWFIAVESGTYTNFDGIIIDDEVAIVLYEDAVFTKIELINKQITNVADDTTEIGKPLLTNDLVFDIEKSVIYQLLEDAATTDTLSDLTKQVVADGLKLDGIEEGAQANVNADWDSVSGDSQILNKPTDLVKGGASSTVNEVSIYSATDGKNVKTSGKIIVSNQTDLKTALALTTAHRIEVTKDITVSGTVTIGALHVIDGSIITFADGIIFSSTSATGLIIDANCNFLGDAVYTSDYNTDIYIRLLTGTPNFTKTTTGELNLRITSVEKNSSITSTAGAITYEDENYFASYEKKPTFTTAFTSAIYDNGNSGTSITLDPANGQSQKLTLTGTCEATLAAVTGSVRLSLKVVQDATGGRDMTFTNTINNPQEFDFTIGTANQKCILTFFYDGEEWWYAASEWID